MGREHLFAVKLTHVTNAQFTHVKKLWALLRFKCLLLRAKHSQHLIYGAFLALSEGSAQEEENLLFLCGDG